MKEAKTILSHLRHAPQFKKLSNQSCINSIKKLFPPHLQEQIRFGYFKQQTLFFVLKHPGAKQEFDIILESIKRPLKLYMPQHCKAMEPFTLKAFVSNRPITNASIPTKPLSSGHYQERASANFVTNKGSQALQRAFSHSAQIIKALLAQHESRS